MSEVALVCGSRNWRDPEPIREFLEHLEPMSLVIHGQAPGVDRFVGSMAPVLGHHVAEVPAFWNLYARSAGPRRNRAMALLAPVIARAAAFPLPESKGTWDMVRLLEEANVVVYIWDQGEFVSSGQLRIEP
jgi:hypothetical protein